MVEVFFEKNERHQVCLCEKKKRKKKTPWASCLGLSNHTYPHGQDYIWIHKC